MEFQRFLIALLLLVCSGLLQAAENPGIVFMHGTSDHREDAYGNYWKTDFIDSVVQALPNPENYFVISLFLS
jgi:hypothetical protein